MGARLGLCLLCVLAMAVPAGPVAAVGPQATGDSQATAPLTTPGDFENTLFRITTYDNGSARWTIQHARPLNDTELDQFEAFAAEFNTQETETFEAFRTRTRSLLAFARNATGRTMTARALDRRAYVNELGQTRGVVELSFMWTDFARSNATTVRVGDVFEGGMYIARNQRLEFRPGPALDFRDVQPMPDSMTDQDSLARSESVTWTGERQFSDQRPAAVFAVGNGSGTGGSGAGTSGGDTGSTGEPSSDGTMPIALAGLVVVAAVLGALAWYRVRGPRGGGVDTTAGTASAGTRRGGSGASGGAARVSEAELLSDEDRVLGLLEENGGRMKQVDIVEETEWSKSKVSMLLSEMEEANKISKLRIGRENVISVAGEEPDAAGSPFEDVD